MWRLCLAFQLQQSIIPPKYSVQLKVYKAFIEWWLFRVISTKFEASFLYVFVLLLKNANIHQYLSAFFTWHKLQHKGISFFFCRNEKLVNWAQTNGRIDKLRVIWKRQTQNEKYRAHIARIFVMFHNDFVC